MNKNNLLDVIIPHRGVNAGKSRLSAVLGDAARSRLNRWLLARTLAAVNAWLADARRCIVVSPCEMTLALARKAGAVALQEQASTPDLNAALSQAAAYSVAHGNARGARLLILPCDLPLLDVAALQAMEAVPVTGADEVIAPDRHYEGTNALLVDADVREFAFGANSYARHLALGKARGVRTVACVQAALAFDLDTADDFEAWVKSGEAPAEFLSMLPHNARRGAPAITSRTK